MNFGAIARRIQRCESEVAAQLVLEYATSEAIAAEREACAKVCDEYNGSWYVYRKGAEDCAAAIRARMTRTPHKHAELIKAWADGANIECMDDNGQWRAIANPQWNSSVQYRIKPEPKPDYVQFIYSARLDANGDIMFDTNGIAFRDKFAVIRNGETGKAIKVEICK